MFGAPASPHACPACFRGTALVVGDGRPARSVEISWCYAAELACWTASRIASAIGPVPRSARKRRRPGWSRGARADTLPACGVRRRLARRRPFGVHDPGGTPLGTAAPRDRCTAATERIRAAHASRAGERSCGSLAQLVLAFGRDRDALDHRGRSLGQRRLARPPNTVPSLTIARKNAGSSLARD